MPIEGAQLEHKHLVALVEAVGHANRQLHLINARLNDIERDLRKLTEQFHALRNAVEVP